ncbi:MAG TPA: hypothetical protein VFV99_17105 [Kofleriaceae bacterium]|nr:hypothetical protein [Kofleriaceae bacterium]
MTRYLACALLLAACSEVHHGVDAGPADAAVDALPTSMGDPTPTSVKLVVTRNGMPVVGVAVVFQNADSSLVSAQLTNDKGLAWTEMAAGGFVTALEHVGSGSDELSTFAAVQPGDSLELAFAPAGPTDEWPVAITVPSDGSAVGYQVYTSCGGPIGLLPGGTATATLLGCDGVADAVVVGEDDTSQPVSAFYAGNLTVPPAAEPPDFGSFAITGSYAPLVTKTFSYANVPPLVSFIGTYHTFVSTHGRVYERTAGDTVSNGSVTTQVQLPATTAASLIVSTLFSSDVGSQTIYETSADASTPYAVDVGAAQLPPFATQPAYDVATRELAWTERSGPQVPNLVRARIHVYRDDIPGGRAWNWRLVAPRTGASVTYPVLPSFGFDFNPKRGDAIGLGELTTVDAPGGYANARRVGFSDLINLVGPGDKMLLETLTTMEP